MMIMMIGIIEWMIEYLAYNLCTVDTYVVIQYFTYFVLNC